MQAQMGEHILDMVAMFGLEGHSGFSASSARQYIDKALRFEPFSPLTRAERDCGEHYEWAGTQQSKRCSHVLRDKAGAAYDITCKVFVEDSGDPYTSSDSRFACRFPDQKRSVKGKRVSGRVE